MKKHLKIAIYSGEIPSTTFIERLVLGISKTAHTVYLFGAQTSKVPYSDSILVVAYTHNKVRKFFHLLKYTLLLSLFRFKDKKKLDDILKSHSKNLIYSKVKSYAVLWHRPDIFHLQWAKGLEEWAWVQEFGMKLVLSLRGAHINYSPIANPELATMYRSYFPKVDGFHAVSNAIATEAIKYGAPEDHIKVIYSGLDMVTFKAKEQQPNEIFKIISVGRPHWVKGYVYALDTCGILKGEGFEFHYIIVGGSKDIELEYQINDLGLQNHVTLLSQKSFEEVKTLIGSADLLLLPSTKEGLANVVLESMALQTPVLATDCGGMEEVITDSKNGFIIPIRDSKSMARKIMDIHSLSEDEKFQIRSEALKTIQYQHTEDKMVKDMLELYTDVNNRK